MAKQGSIKCPKCDRTFKMALHLGRHMSTVHAPKGEGVKTAAKAKRVKRPTKTPRHAAATGIAAVLGDIQRYRVELAAQRAALDSQMAAIDQALAVLGAGVPAREAAPDKKPQAAGYRSGSLKAHIQKVMQARGRPMAVRDVTAAVRKAGYKSKNKTLDKSVGIALAEMPSVTKIRRGIFRLR